MKTNVEPVDIELYKRHKELFTRVVMPVILITTTFLIISHWRNDAIFYTGLAICLGLDVFNVYFSIKNRVIKTPFGEFHSRSDGFDAFRWCLNLLLDTYLVFSLQLEIASAVFIWLILTFGALSEVFYFRNRLITVSVAALCFVYIIYMYDMSWRTNLYVFACYGGLVFILHKFERNLVKTLTDYFQLEQSKKILESEQDLLRRESVLGVQAMTICHEINNVLTIISGSSSNLRAGQSMDPATYAMQVERLNRAVGSITYISNLVLSDIGSDWKELRVYSVAELIRDFEVLLGSHFKFTSGVNFKMHMPSGEHLNFTRFRETPGSTYLIAHNLVKNAIEAYGELSSRKAKVVVELSLEVHQDVMKLSVVDFAGGMPDSVKNAVLSGNRITTKHDGHGLGLKFVADQIQKSDMKLYIDVAQSSGTTVTIEIPIVRRQQSPKLIS